MSIRIFKAACLTFGLAMLVQSMTQAQSFGIRAGVNLQNINGKDASGDKVKNDLVPRFHAGVQVDIPIAPGFFFQPGLLFTTKGAKGDAQLFEGTITRNVNIYYVELPLSFLYKPVLGNGHLLLGLGPYVAYGIGGKAKFEGAGISETQDVKFKKTVSLAEAAQAVYFRPFDYGANLFAGYQFANGLFFQLNTQLGLGNISPEYEGVPNNDTSLQNTGFGLSVGYGF